MVAGAVTEDWRTHRRYSGNTDLKSANFPLLMILGIALSVSAQGFMSLCYIYGGDPSEFVAIHLYIYFLYIHIYKTSNSAICTWLNFQVYTWLRKFIFYKVYFVGFFFFLNMFRKTLFQDKFPPT